MPIFGARMVCDSGNYRHIQEVTTRERERETSLGKWVSEKSRRKAALKELKELTKRAEKVKESQSRHNSLGQESPELRDLARLRGRRSNSLVTELLYRDPRHPATSAGSDPDLALSSDTEETHVTRMRLLRIESYGDILDRKRRRSDSPAPAPSNLLQTPDTSRRPSNTSASEDDDEDTVDDKEEVDRDQKDLVDHETVVESTDDDNDDDGKEESTDCCDDAGGDGPVGDTRQDSDEGDQDDRDDCEDGDSQDIDDPDNDGDMDDHDDVVVDE